MSRVSFDLFEKVLWSLHSNSETVLEHLAQPKDRAIPGDEDGASSEHVCMQMIPIPPIRELRIAFLPVGFELEPEGLELLQAQLISL